MTNQFCFILTDYVIYARKNRRNMGRKQTPPFAMAPYQHSLSLTNGNFFHNICIMHLLNTQDELVSHKLPIRTTLTTPNKKKTTHAHFRQRGGVYRVWAEHSHLLLVYGESILERSIELNVRAARHWLRLFAQYRWQLHMTIPCLQTDNSPNLNRWKSLKFSEISETLTE